MLTSCAPKEIYRSGGWYDSGALLNELQHGAASHTGPEMIAELFPPYSYQRQPPTLFGLTSFLEQLRSSNSAVEQRFNHGAACALIRIAESYVCGSVVYAVKEEQLHVLYETYRPNEQHLLSLQTLEHLRSGADGRQLASNVMFVGSAGSRNYGHWLVDDLARLKALFAIQGQSQKPFTIVLQRLGRAIDRVRAESIKLLVGSSYPVSVVYIGENEAVRFENLYYSTPVSYHPHLKSPEAMSFIRDRLTKAVVETASAASEPSPRIFVQRRDERGRSLKNIVDVIDLLSRFGFVAVDPEDLDFGEQVRLFSGAELIVGTMGAAMTNSMFSSPSCRVMYLAPDGWVETFYWDLASVLGQSYAVVYGHSDDPRPNAHERSFSIALSDLLSGLKWLLS